MRKLSEPAYAAVMGYAGGRATQSPLIEWPDVWGTPSYRELAFFRRPWVSVLGGLIAALPIAWGFNVMGGPGDGIGFWPLYAVGASASIIAATLIPSDPGRRDNQFWNLVTLAIPAWWAMDKVDDAWTFRSVWWLLATAAAVWFLVTWGPGAKVAHWVVSQVLVDVKPRGVVLARPKKKENVEALVVSPEGLSWGVNPKDRVPWEDITSFEPIPWLRVSVSGRRDLTIDLSETIYGAAVSLHLLNHYLGHPQDRGELHSQLQFRYRAKRAQKAGLAHRAAAASFFSRRARA